MSAAKSLFKAKTYGKKDDWEASFARGKLVSTLNSKTVVDLMISAVKNMQNLHEYRFELRDLLLTPDSEKFLVTIRQAVGPNLRKLSLQSSVARFRSIMDLNDFPNLDELELSLVRDFAEPSNASLVTESDELTASVVPFLNLQRDTLSTLKFASYSSVDLSPLFDDIGSFHRLRRLYVNICFDECHLSDVTSFTKFLQRHQSVLTYLELKAMRPDGDDIGLEEADKLRQESWARVQRSLIDGGITFECLTALHMPSWNVDLTKQVLARHSSSLTHLSLRDESLSLSQLQGILDLFAYHPMQLKSLLIQVYCLEFAYLNLLARRLLGLRSVVVIFNRAVAPAVSRFSHPPTRNLSHSGSDKAFRRRGCHSSSKGV